MVVYLYLKKINFDNKQKFGGKFNKIVLKTSMDGNSFAGKRYREKYLLV